MQKNPEERLLLQKEARPQDARLFNEMPPSEIATLREKMEKQGIQWSEDLLKTLLTRYRVHVPAEMFNPLPSQEHEDAVGTFLASICDDLERIKQWRPPTIRRAGDGIGPSYGHFHDLLLIMTFFIEQWAQHPQALNTFEKYIEVSKKYHSYIVNGSEFARIIGSNWEVWKNIVSAPLKEEMEKNLIENYPQHILTTQHIASLSPAVCEQYAVGAALNGAGFHIVHLPYGLDALTNRLELQTHTVCDSAEGYFLHTSKNPSAYVKLLYRGAVIGMYKKLNERTFVVTRTVVENDKIVLVKGGIYEFHGMRIDETQQEVDLAQELTPDTSIVPLRMWQQRNSYDFMSPTYDPRSHEKILEPFSDFVSRIEKPTPA